MNFREVPMDDSSTKLPPLQVVSLALSIYVLGALIFETVFKVSGATLQMLDRIDFVICFFFLYDFAVRFHHAESKLKFMKWGWFDLISSIPLWGCFQWARAIRVVRMLRALRSTRILVSFLYKDKSLGSLVSAVLIAGLMMIFCSMAVLNFETDPQSNIKDPEDAIWWAFSTVSTVGYGDKYPVTLEGRLTAVVLIVCGVGLFGIYTAYIAKLFVAEDRKEENPDIKRLSEEIRQLRLQIEKLAESQNILAVIDRAKKEPDFAVRKEE